MFKFGKKESPIQGVEQISEPQGVSFNQKYTVSKDWTPILISALSLLVSIGSLALNNWYEDIEVNAIVTPIDTNLDEFDFRNFSPNNYWVNAHISKNFGVTFVNTSNRPVGIKSVGYILVFRHNEFVDGEISENNTKYCSQQKIDGEWIHLEKSEPIKSILEPFTLNANTIETRKLVLDFKDNVPRQAVYKSKAAPGNLISYCLLLKFETVISKARINSTTFPISVSFLNRSDGVGSDHKKINLGSPNTILKYNNVLQYIFEY